MEFTALISPVRAKRAATCSPPKSPHPKRKRLQKTFNSRYRRRYSDVSLIGDNREQASSTEKFLSNIDCLTSMIESQNLQAPHAVRGLSFSANFGANSTLPWNSAIQSVAKKSSQSNPADVVRIAVGGTVFKTRRATVTNIHGSLLRDTFLRGTSSASFPDRDAAYFEIILKWLQDRTVTRCWPVVDTRFKAEARYFGVSQAMFGDGCIVTVGGEDDNGPSAQIQLYDPIVNRWTEAGTLPHSLDAHATAFLDSTIFISGGCDASGAKQAAVYAFDPHTRRCEVHSMMNFPRCRHKHVVVGSKMMVIGGLISKSKHDTANTRGVSRHRAVSASDGHNSLPTFVEHYDNTTASWVGSSTQEVYRYGFGTAVLGNDLYVVGGLALNGARTADVRRYNAATDTWSSVAPLQQPRAYVAVAVLHGRIYAIGGNDVCNHPTDTVEIYDPVTNRWHFGPRIQSSRCDAGCVVLNGIIYVCGGEDGENYVASVECFDPLTGIWSAGKAMPSPKSSQGVCVVPY
eukprot:m.127039 g.127039  ORF g.127039 m.127039 type:complete len:516 (-) comp17404_c0_seq1:223-1770(-)